MGASALYPYVMPSISITGSAATSRSKVNLRDLPKRVLGRIPHVVAFLFDVTLTPTFTAAPTVAGMNNLFSQMDLWDGSVNRFVGGFNHIRCKERLETGRVRYAYPATGTASTNARYFRRVLHTGPANFKNWNSDFAIPTCILETGELRWTSGVLTDISADTTAYTASIKVTAVLSLLDEVRIPPAYEFTNISISGKDATIPGEALYETVALLPQGGFGTSISAGDYGTLRLSLGTDDVIASVDSQTLTAMYQDLMNVGEIGGFNGDPEGTADTDQKIVNRGTPTALTSAAPDIQVVLHSGPQAMISKLFYASKNARIRWGGSQSSAVTCILSRLLPQPQSVVQVLAAKAANSLGMPVKSAKPKTLSKTPYKGPYLDFMPWDLTV